MKIFILSSLILLSACHKAEWKVGDKDGESLSRSISDQKGRFEFIHAAEKYPAMVFDSATGCLLTVNVLETGPNAGNVQIAGVIGTCPELPIARYVPKGENK